MRIQRIYDAPDGGRRVLVDRLWPRGVSREAAGLDAWARELAPSDELRRAFHGGLSFAAFEARYRSELEGADLAVLEGDDVVLLTAARGAPNHADVLKAVAEEARGRARPEA